MTLGLFTSAIPIIDSTKMAFFFGASIAVGMVFTFVPWLYEEPEENNDIEELDVSITQTSNESTEEESLSSTQIHITHRRKIIRFDPEIEVQQLSVQSRTNSDKTSSEKSTEFLSIIFPTGTHDKTPTEIHLYPKTKNPSMNNQHLNIVGPQQTNYLTHRNNQKAFQEAYKLNNGYQRFSDDKKAAEMNISPQQKIAKPPRAHPPSRRKSLKANGCQSTSEKCVANVQTQTVDILNHLEHSEKISKVKESSQDMDINKIHERSLYPVVNVVIHGSESSTFPLSSSANGDQEVDSSQKSPKMTKYNNNIENAPKKTLRKKSVKFDTEKNFFTSSESCENSFQQSLNRKMGSSSFVNRCRRMLSFNKSEKDLVKSKSSISSAIGRTPTGHSTPIERSSDLSEERQGYSGDAFGNESKQKHQLNQSGNLSRRPKVLLLTRGIPSCLIQDLNLIHEKSNSKLLASSTISETLTSSDQTKNQSQDGNHNAGIKKSDFTTTGSNNNDITDNNSNYNSGWIPRLNKDMHQVIRGIRKYIKVPKMNGNFQPSNKDSVNKDMNNNNNGHYNNKYNNESSINYSSWKFKSCSTLNKSHSLTFLKTEINSSKKYSSLPELKDRRFFSRWSNFLPC